MTILGIETSCDETAAALVENGHTLISQSVASSLEQHKITGGIVPEVAARAQIEYITPVLHATLENIKLSAVTKKALPEKTHLPVIANIDAIAVTVGPGLIGSLLVGVETAKSLAYAWNKPLIPINHMLGHIYGAWLTYGEDMDRIWPKLALLVSGGHTELILLKSHTDMQKIGQTLDDAAGEAFDKVAKLLGLEYPGGPSLSKLAEIGDPLAISFPLPMNQKSDINFSFSGLKTAVLHYVRQHPSANKADIAASFQHTVITSLVNKTKHAAQQYGAKEIILGGGVAANKLLRQQLSHSLLPIPVRIPALEFTTDNGAVIAAAAHYHNHPVQPFDIQVSPNLPLGRPV